VHQRVAVDLGRRRLEDLGLQPPREAQHIDRTNDAWSSSSAPDRAGSARARRGRRGCSLVDLHNQRMGHIVGASPRNAVTEQVPDILLAPGEVVVDAQDVMAWGDQAFAQMRAEEPAPPVRERALMSAHRNPRVVFIISSSCAYNS